MSRNSYAAVAVALATAATGLASSAPAAASASPGGSSPSPASSSPAAAQSIAWKNCGDSAHPKLECATVKVPLDHAEPNGRAIRLALSRIPHTASTYQGPLLVNPGGPGGSGISMAAFVAGELPADVAAQYDVIGFDPRGVGRSEPALDCKPGHFNTVRPDTVPRSLHEESANMRRAESFARACGRKYGDLLKHISTVSTAKDIDVVRTALGAEKINYFGYSYGTYLGAVYAKLYPERVRRLVLDSIVDPTGIWYEDNIAQDYAFDDRHKAFMAWIAKHDAAYGLGTDPAKVEAEWYAVRTKLRAAPAGKKVGPTELEDTFLPGGYYNGYWPLLAEGFAAYAKNGDEQALVDLYETFAAVDSNGDNGYSVYTAVECRDAKWPRDWWTWHTDARKVNRKAPFLTWNNTWYNAPCAFWPTSGLSPVNVSNDTLPPALLLQATDDAATPYEGGVTMHRLLKKSRLVVESGGGNHGISLSGNACLDEYLVDYLRDGSLPRSRPGADASCRALPDPEPAPPAVQEKPGTGSGSEPGAASGGESGSGTGATSGGTAARGSDTAAGQQTDGAAGKKAAAGATPDGELHRFLKVQR